MAKKKTSSKVIPLAGYISSNFIPSSVTSSQIESIPPYPDPGVRLEGYAKRLNNLSYELLRQQENSILFVFGSNLAGVPAGTYVINKGHEEQNFVFDHLSISYIQSGIYQELQILDERDGVITLELPTTTGNIVNLNINPKIMKGSTIRLVLLNAIPINEFIAVDLFGWYEDK